MRSLVLVVCALSLISAEPQLRQDGGGLALAADARDLVSSAAPRWWWRTDGSTTWSQASPAATISGGDGGWTLTANDGGMQVVVEARRDGARVVLAGRIRNTGTTAVELARMHLLDGVTASDQRLTESHLLRTWTVEGDVTPAPPGPPPPQRKPWVLPKPHPEANIALGLRDRSSEDWAVLGALDAPAWCVGAIGDSAFGRISLRNEDGVTRLGLGCDLDRLLLPPGGERALEPLALWHGDWLDALSAWADAVAALPGRTPRLGAPHAGWCSWYQYVWKVEPKALDQALREFPRLGQPAVGKLVVQIDDGFQAMPGDWGPNERWRAAWPGLAQRIAATGALPGLWLAPAHVFHRHPLMRGDSVLVLRGSDGQPTYRGHNWAWCDGFEMKDLPVDDPRVPMTYYLDVSHPGGRDAAAATVRAAVTDGWRYLKIDFTQVMPRGSPRHDRSRTTYEILRDSWRAYRSAAGNDTYLLACTGGPRRWTIGSADAARIDGDIVGTYEDMRRILQRCAIKSVINGRWYATDPDVFYLRGRMQINDNQKRLITGLIGCMGGLLLTSDQPSQWGAQRALAERWWRDADRRPAQAQRLAFDAHGRMQAYVTTRRRDGGLRHRVAILNHAAGVADVRIPFAALRIPPGETVDVQDAAAVRRDGDALLSPAQPGTSLRVVDVVEAAAR